MEQEPDGPASRDPRVRQIQPLPSAQHSGRQLTKGTFIKVKDTGHQDEESTGNQGFKNPQAEPPKVLYQLLVCALSSDYKPLRHEGSLGFPGWRRHRFTGGVFLHYPDYVAKAWLCY